MGRQRYCTDSKLNTKNYIEFCRRHELPPNKYTDIFSPFNTGDGFKLYIAYVETYGVEDTEVLRHLKSNLSSPRYHVHDIVDGYISLVHQMRPEWKRPESQTHAVLIEYIIKNKLDYTEDDVVHMTDFFIRTWIKGSTLLRILDYHENSLMYMSMGYEGKELKDIFETLYEQVPEQIPTGYVLYYISREWEEALLEIRTS